MLPAASAVTARPVADVVNFRVASAGSAAACAVWTTMTLRQPPTSSAVTWRSMSGRTPAYRAVEPLSEGAGSGNGAVTASVLPSCVARVAIGPDPPPEKLTCTGDSTGATELSAFLRSVMSIADQEPPDRARTGFAFSVVASRPVGKTVVCEVAVVSASTTTAAPVDLARASAVVIACCSAVGAGRLPAGGLTVSGEAGPCPGGCPVPPVAEAGAQIPPRTRANVKAGRSRRRARGVAPCDVPRRRRCRFGAVVIGMAEVASPWSEPFPPGRTMRGTMRGSSNEVKPGGDLLSHVHLVPLLTIKKR